MRVNIYLRNMINNSSMVPIPITQFITPRCSDVTLQLLIVNLGEDKEPLDLDGAEIDFIIRKNRHYCDDSDILVHKTINNGVYVETDYASDGWVDVDLTANDLDLAACRYYYDLRIVNNEDQLIRQAMGKFTLLP